MRKANERCLLIAISRTSNGKLIFWEATQVLTHSVIEFNFYVKVYIFNTMFTK